MTVLKSMGKQWEWTLLPDTFNNEALERQRTQANAERLGIQFVPADDERSA